MKRVIVITLFLILCIAVGCTGTTLPTNTPTSPAVSSSAPSATPTMISPTQGTPTKSPTAPVQPIKFGIESIMSGAFASNGIPGVRGAELAIQFINEQGGILGRPAELYARDSQGSTSTAVKLVRELIQGQGVKFMVTAVSSACALAEKAVVEETNAILIAAGPHSSKITGSQYSPNVFRVCDQGQVRIYGIIELLRQKYPNVHKWANISPDYEYGRDCWTHFTKRMKELDPMFEVVADRWPKAGAAGGYGSDINVIIASGAAGLYTGLYGGDAVAFIREGRGYGIFDKIQVFASGVLPQDAAYALGKDMVEMWGGDHYLYTAFTNQEADKFNKAFAQKWGEDYLIFGQSQAVPCFDAIMAYKIAIEKAGTDNTQAVIKALEDLRFKSPLGEKWIRPGDHQAYFGIPYFHVVPDSSTTRGYRIAESTILDGTKLALSPEEARKL